MEEEISTGKVSLYDYMIKDKNNYDYVVEKVKKPFMKAIILLSRRFAEPTHENCTQPNSHILLDIKENISNSMRMDEIRTKMILAIFRVLIDVYDHDPVYRYIINRLVRMLVSAVIHGQWQDGADRPPQPMLWNDTDIKAYFTVQRLKDLVVSNRFR